MKKKHMLKEEIEWCLENRPNTRNSDKLLWISVCYNYYNLGIRFPIQNLEEFHDLIMIYPGEDAIKRFRAQFNAKGLYWPTDPKVIKERRLKVKEVKEDLGYTTQEQAITISQERMLLKETRWWEKD